MQEARFSSDEELLSAIQDKKTLNQAILHIYRAYCNYVSSFIIKYGGTQQDAEDNFQETVVAFIDIVQRGRFRKESSIKTFLVSIAKNTWLNEVKKRQRSERREEKYEGEREQHDIDVSHFLTERETKKEWSRLLDRLGESCKKILLLFYYENLSMKEIVQVLPYENEQVVRNKKYKCLQQLSALVRDKPVLEGQVRIKN